MSVQWTRIALPAAVALFVLLALALPVARLRSRDGVWAFTAWRHKGLADRAITIVLMTCVAWVGLWADLYAAWGPEPLGLWPLPAWTSWAGWVLMASGLLIVVVAQAQMGASWRIGIESAPTSLVTGGLYRWSRNPIYSGMFAIIGGFVCVAPSPWTAGLGAIAVLTVCIQTRREEAHMRRTHGAEFEGWAAQVGRFSPWVGRLRS